MGCNCGGRRARAVGRPRPDAKAVIASADRTKAARAATSRGNYKVSCAPNETFTSLLKANRAARDCGGRVEPA